MDGRILSYNLSCVVAHSLYVATVICMRYIGQPTGTSIYGICTRYCGYLGVVMVTCFVTLLRCLVAQGQQANKEDKDNKHWRDNKQHKVLSLQIKQWISTLEQEVCLAHTSLHCMMVDLTQRPITFAFTSWLNNVFSVTFAFHIIWFAHISMSWSQ